MHSCTAARNHFHRSTFSFSESRTAFSFALQKKKWFWPPPGRQKSDFPRKGYAPSARRLSQTTSATPSENHRPGGVNTNKQVTVFHPLNGSAQKGPRVVQTQAAENRRIPQSPSPEEYHNSTNPTPGCTAPPQDFHWSTFSFSESRTAFSFAVQKKKWFWPSLGKRKNNPQPGRQKPTAR